MEAGGQSEHSWFVTAIHHPNQFNLASSAMGPMSARPGKKHPAPKPTRSAMLTRMSGPPVHVAPSSSSQLGLAATQESIVPSGNSIVRISDSTATSQDILPESQAGVDDSKCIARIWAGGVGGQCKNRRKTGDYCGKHNTSERRPHGRVDEAVPLHKNRSFIKRAGCLLRECCLARLQEPVMERLVCRPPPKVLYKII